MSLKFRLSLLVSLLLLATIATISIVAYIEVEEILLKNIDSRLKTIAGEITAKLDEPLSREARQAEFLSITAYAGGRKSAIYRIWMDGSKDTLFVSGSVADANTQLLVNLTPDSQPEVGELTYFNLDLNKYPYRAVWTRHPLEQGVANILVAHSSRDAYHEINEFLKLILILGVSMVLGTFLLLPSIIALGMRPIEWVAGRMRRIKPRELGQESLYNPKVPSELRPFVEALSEMLARLDKAMQQQKRFTAYASHELRTPLALIKSTIQTSRMRDRNIAEYKQAMDEVLKDIERMEKLTTQMLSLARMDETDVLPNPSKVPLDVLLRNLVETYDFRVSPKGGRVVCEEFHSVWVWGNEGELTQLFNNLLDNAVQYGPPNGTVQITLQDRSDGYVTVCIHNEGDHIPPQALPHLFDRFYRVDSSRSAATGGTGLGLAIAREISRRHGGDIEITSNPAAGTSVFVRLPKL